MPSELLMTSMISEESPNTYIVNNCEHTQVESAVEVETSIPIFTLKYGNKLIPVMGDRSDYHVEDLSYAFHDEHFARNVVKYANI